MRMSAISPKEANWETRRNGRSEVNGPGHCLPFQSPRLTVEAEARAAALAYWSKSVIKLVRRREGLLLGAVMMRVSEGDRNSCPCEGCVVYRRSIR